jgi:hypothetical protein
VAATPDEPVVEGTAVVLFARDARDPRLGAFVEPEQLALGARSVFVQFDLAPLRERGQSVERATLLLTPHPLWRTASGAARVAVHALSEPLSAPGRPDPEAVGDPVALATVPRGLRAPVRVDVTAVARGWWDRSLPPGGLALSADGDGVVVYGALASAGDARPRLEVVVR